MSAGKECTISHYTDPPVDTDLPVDTAAPVGYTIYCVADPSLFEDTFDNDDESFGEESNPIGLKSGWGERG